MREVQVHGERVIWWDVLARKHRLSDRQRVALTRALEIGGLTIQDFEVLCPGVSRRTLQRELKAMVDKGLLTPEGATNRLYYRLAQTAP
jgi:DNA-binding HxlR family transcriptional regulator